MQVLPPPVLGGLYSRWESGILAGGLTALLLNLLRRAPRTEE